MALSALSLFIGYLWFRPAWLRGAILLLSLPLVYLGNVIRISSIILAAGLGGQVWGDRVHDLMGFGVFVVVLGGVVAIAEAIARSRPIWTVDGPSSIVRPSNSALWEPTSAVVAAIVISLAFGCAVFLDHRSSQPRIEYSGVKLTKDGANPIDLPTFLGSEWMGSSIEPTTVERSILPPDTGYSRKLYVSREGADQQVFLSIVLSGRDRTSIHRPELCLVGQGWTIESSSSHSFNYPGRSDANFKATILMVRRILSGPNGEESVPELVAYWYVGADQIVSNQVERMAFDAWNRIVHGRSDRWAYVLLKTGASDGDDAALVRMQSVLNSALPEFQMAIGIRKSVIGGQ
jgi:EpsI family protein